MASEGGWNESLKALDERRDSEGNFIFSEAWFEPEEVHPWRAKQVEDNRTRRETESAGYAGFEDSFSFKIANYTVPDKTPQQKAAREDKWRLKLETRVEAARLRELQQNHPEPKLQPKSIGLATAASRPAAVPPTRRDTLPALHEGLAMDIDPPLDPISNPQSTLPFHPVPPPPIPPPIPTPVNVTTRSITVPERRRRPASCVDLSLDSDDDDILIVSEAGIAPLSGSARPQQSNATIKQPPQQTKTAPVVRVSTETRGRKSNKRDYSTAGTSTAVKKPKRVPTLAELIAARKKTKVGEKISFSTIEDYEMYLKPATVPPNLVFSSCRIILLNYNPPLNSSLHPYVMNWVDLVATKGGTLVSRKDFVAPPSSAEVDLDWTRASGRDAKGDASLRQQAKEQNWTTHIVVIDAQFPSAINPPPATLDSVLESLGLDSLTKASLGNYVKIVRTGWLSGSGAEVVPCSEVGHELFVNERRTEMVNEADERVKKSRRKAKEKSVALDREREARDTSEEPSGDERPDSDYDYRDYPDEELQLPLYVATTTIPSTIPNATTDDVYNEHNYPHNVNFKDIEEELRAVEELESAEEENDSTKSSDSDQFDDASEIPTQKKPTRKLKRIKSNRNPKELGMSSGRFQCELASLQGSKKSGPNEHLAKVFDELGKFNEEDPWRFMAYRKASGALRRWKTPIKTVDDAKGIFGIGDRSRQRLDIILKTGTHPRLQMDVGRQESIKLFTSIYGVGTRTASKWYDVLGLRSIKDVREKITLNAGQLLGLQYFLDLQRRIPRPEVTELFSHVQKAAARVHPGLQVECMGSYRRGQPDCGDIDILVTLDHRKYKQDHTGMISKLLRYLVEADVVQHELSVSDDPNALDLTFHGLCSLPGGQHAMRRMDILVVPFDDLPAALIYFTGNDIFNRSLRLKARKMGYSLNQIALTKNVTRHKAGGPLSNQKSNEGQRVPGIKTEADIFRVLGVTMRPPHERQP